MVTSIGRDSIAWRTTTEFSSGMARRYPRKIGSRKDAKKSISPRVVQHTPKLLGGSLTLPLRLCVFALLREALFCTEVSRRSHDHRWPLMPLTARDGLGPSERSSGVLSLFIAR